MAQFMVHTLSTPGWLHVHFRAIRYSFEQYYTKSIGLLKVGKPQNCPDKPETALVHGFL